MRTMWRFAVVAMRRLILFEWVFVGREMYGRSTDAEVRGGFSGGVLQWFRRREGFGFR